MLDDLKNTKLYVGEQMQKKSNGSTALLTSYSHIEQIQQEPFSSLCFGDTSFHQMTTSLYWFIVDQIGDTVVCRKAIGSKGTNEKY